MRNLNFRSATDFEDFCCWWMTEIIKKRTGRIVSFACYGSPGQAQGGVDITSNPIRLLPVVAQCKWYSSPFTLVDLKAELKKTDNYPHPITHYFLLTTANKHRTIQDAMTNGYLTHMRKDGTSFEVHIHYWRELENIDFLPLFMREIYFPEAGFTSKTKNMAEQFTRLKLLLEQQLPVSNLDWLETWDFSIGYINSADFEPFNKLAHNYHLVKSSFDNSDDIFLDTPLRDKLYQCLPAGNGFFQALVAFCNGVSSHIIGDSINGKESLSVRDLPNRHAITRQWISNAEYLAKKYRDIAEWVEKQVQ
ncbi:hypothetical protein OQ486_11740 [Plesiomonas shigelloides]|uniref:hypothetical protein n=1 Tax=Plesiomonas shigelloides TaxID=703 RepID=UPI00224585E3|nr:hypothetical protein [Plesiomonas shigelloides]MCX2534139.1 hypothetical protein [Plesiomonas shigelloides]